MDANINFQLTLRSKLHYCTVSSYVSLEQISWFEVELFKPYSNNVTDNIINSDQSYIPDFIILFHLAYSENDGNFSNVRQIFDGNFDRPLPQFSQKG